MFYSIEFDLASKFKSFWKWDRTGFRFPDKYISLGYILEKGDTRKLYENNIFAQKGPNTPNRWGLSLINDDSLSVSAILIGKLLNQIP